MLFPIYLTEHNDNWSVWYADEERHLKGCFPADRMKRISHIGSTAIKGIWAKPTIDILAEVVPECDFRDYLNVHPEVAKEYEKLKLSLWKQCEHNRDGYTESKTAFVKEYTQKAKIEFEDRYVITER